MTGASTPRGPAGPAAVPAAKPLPEQLPAAAVAAGGTPKPRAASAPGRLGGGEVSPHVLVAPSPNPPASSFPRRAATCSAACTGPGVTTR